MTRFSLLSCSLFILAIGIGQDHAFGGNPFPKITIKGAPDITRPLRRAGRDIQREANNAQRQANDFRRNAQREIKNAERQIYDARQNLFRELENAKRRVKELVRVENNRGQVQASLRNGSYIAWGKEIDHVEYQNFAVAVTASVAVGNPGPVQLYLKYMLIQMKQELARNLRGEARQFLRDFEMTIVRALRQIVTTQRPVSFRFGGIDLQVGIASYNHWKNVSGHYPEIYGNRIKWTYAERRIPLPNTHQPYVRFRVRFGYQ